MLPRNYDTKYWMQKEKYTSIFGGTPNLMILMNPIKPLNQGSGLPFLKIITCKRTIASRKINHYSNSIDGPNCVLEGNINNIYIKRENKELGAAKKF